MPESFNYISSQGRYIIVANTLIENQLSSWYLEGNWKSAVATVYAN